MNKPKIILDLNDILNTYQKEMPHFWNPVLNERKWLPLFNDSDLASEFAYLVAKVMGDGHLSKNFNLYFSGQKRELEELRLIIVKKLRINPERLKIIFGKSKGIWYKLRVNDSLLSRALFHLGAPMGNKTKCKFLVPYWIINSRINSKLFLQGLLEDELTTIKIEKKTHSNKPRLKMAKSEELLPNLREFLNQVKAMLEYFDVECGTIPTKTYSRENQDTRELYFNLSRSKENIVRFAENVNFRAHFEKSRILNDCVEILKDTIHVRNPNIDVLKIIKLRKQGCSIRKIGAIVNLNKTSVHNIVKKYK